MRILIVDDSSMMRAMIKRVVKLTNVPVEEILEAGDGAAGPLTARIARRGAAAHRHQHAGDERRRAAAPRWPTTIAGARLTRVIISTDGSTARREEAAELSVRCYLEKPFSPEVLRDVLSDAAEAARL